MSEEIIPADYRQHFPKMSADNHELTSNPTRMYNCIAWAAGENDRWWEPNLPMDAGYYWPDDVPADFRPESLVAAFSAIGYAVCDDGTLVQNIEKIALYRGKGEWTHAARQLADGRWTSKLGPAHDISHDAPECVNGDEYGSVFCFMQRRTA